MKVTVVNCTPDHNNGASAISWGLVRRLSGDRLVDDITLVSKSAATGDPEFRHTVERFGDEVPLLPSPFVERQSGARRPVRDVAALLVRPSAFARPPAVERS